VAFDGDELVHCRIIQKVEWRPVQPELSCRLTG
jgi:hypothetical protein